MNPKTHHHPRQLHYPLPSRIWEPTADGWASRQWTPADLAEAHRAGAWENGTQDLATRHSQPLR